MDIETAKHVALLVNRLDELKEIGEQINYIVTSKSVNVDEAQRLGCLAVKCHELATRLTKQELFKL